MSAWSDAKGRQTRPLAIRTGTRDNAADSGSVSVAEAMQATRPAAPAGSPSGVAIIEAALKACCRNAAQGIGHNAGCPSITNPRGYVFPDKPQGGRQP